MAPSSYDNMPTPIAFLNFFNKAVPECYRIQNVTAFFGYLHVALDIWTKIDIF